jgi:hypothetical protein
MPKFDYFLAYLMRTTVGRSGLRHLLGVNKQTGLPNSVRLCARISPEAMADEFATPAGFYVAAVSLTCSGRLAGMVKKGQPKLP